jgi:spermidine synthase
MNAADERRRGARVGGLRRPPGVMTLPAIRDALEKCLKALAEKPGTANPTVVKTANALSLHFDRQTTQSLMSRRDPDKLVLGYTRTMMGFLLFHPAPALISMIGLGGGSLVKYCYRKLPTTRIVAVEIDPAVIALRGQFSIPPDDERLEIVCADGAAYLAKPGDEPDVILVDGFSPEGMPAQLGNAEFYANCHARLSATGVLVANVLASDLASPRYLAGIGAVFGKSMSVVLSEDDCNYTVFAWKEDNALPALATLLKRARLLEAVHSITFTITAHHLKPGECLAANPALWHALPRARD